MEMIWPTLNDAALQAGWDEEKLLRILIQGAIQAKLMNGIIYVDPEGLRDYLARKEVIPRGLGETDVQTIE